MDIKRRVVITGMGVMSSLGHSEGEIIHRLKNGRVSFSRPLFDPDVVISPIKDFDLKSFSGHFKDRRYLTRAGELCLAAAIQAINDSGMEKGQLSEAGLFIGVGPNFDMGNEGPRMVDGHMVQDDLMALWMLKFLPNTATSTIAKYAGIHGANLTVTTACAASLQAIGEAFGKIRTGYLDLALAGGGDSRLHPGGILAFKKANALYAGPGDPEQASRSFDAQRSGFVPGEGGAVFVLEELSRAEKRGAKVYAEVCGYGSSLDGYNMTAPAPDGRWTEKALNDALKEAVMTPQDIDLVSAHGTGTILNDDMEAMLLDRVFRDLTPFVIATKSWIGHIAAACGALELAVGLCCMENGYLPEIRNLNTPCHDRVRFVTEPIHATANTMLLQNFGFGGQNGVLIVKRSA